MFDSIESTISSIRAGEFVIVLDSEDRENEGDLIISASNITTQQMAYMIKHSSGFICISLHPSIISELEIPMMVPNNDEKNKTAYTVTVDYKWGATTGISAKDRAITSRMLAKVTKNGSRGKDREGTPIEKEILKLDEDQRLIYKKDFTRPGHLNPLRYTEGGVRIRQGHTEASVDLSLAAGLPGAALLCELVDPDDPDGGIASRDACLKFAKQHGLKVTTIEMLKKWREETEGELSLDIESVGRKVKSSSKNDSGSKSSKVGAEEIKDLDRKRGVDIEGQKVVGPMVNGNGA